MEACNELGIKGNPYVTALFSTLAAYTEICFSDFNGTSGNMGTGTFTTFINPTNQSRKRYGFFIPA